jgi:predicted SprT family Zn-dependent metalloprotease
MFATQKEIDLYTRMTLKQWGMSHLKIEWIDAPRRWLGAAYVHQKKIQLTTAILVSFKTFEEVLKHEVAHHIQFLRNGNRWLTTPKGRNSFHGKDFAAVCKEMGIPARTHIPLPTIRYIYA